MSYEAWGEPDEIDTCPSCAELYSEKEELDKIIDNLASLVRRLVAKHPDTGVAAAALEYLRHIDNLGSPLRKEDLDV